MGLLAAMEARGGPFAWCRRRGWLVALALLVCVQASAQPTPTKITDEYKLQAVFLFNFAQFVEWPGRAFPTADGPLVIGILGQDPFGAYLDDLVRGERVRGHPLQVRRFGNAEAAANCHLLYISRSEAARLVSTLAAFRGRSVLTLSDAETFTRAGGMVRFATENGRIRLRINLEAAKASGLIISSKIIRPATIVAPGKE